MTTLIYKIPPNLPLPKGGFSPLFGKEGCGEIFWTNVNSIMRPLVSLLASTMEINRKRLNYFCEIAFICLFIV
jgi:hypothetical protein